jgi:tetratricopeptide (TPR) repeat protein
VPPRILRRDPRCCRLTTASHSALLRERLERYPAARYPVQRATILFHLGVTLTDADEPAEAVPALRESCSLFDPHRLPVEHAKAQNALGAALRAVGALDDAAVAFERAAGVFAATGLQREEGAARFNLGLALRAAGRLDEARLVLRAARELLSSSRSHAAAAARELGATLLELGEVDPALTLLTDAADLAERAGDRAGAGAARNARGLAELVRGDTAAAVDDFRAAAHAHPRGLRPAEHAMAKANLALAYERRGSPAHARLAARQALAAPVVPEAVRGQAEAVLRRLGGGGPGLVVEVLASADPGEKTGIVRDEVVRWIAETSDVRRAEARAWIDAQAGQDEPAAIDMAELLLGVLLEQPPEEMETIIRGVIEAARDVAPELRDPFRSATAQAMARFHVPQMIRLRDTFSRLAAELGAEGWR